MSDEKTIHFYFDPGCPWAYLTSLWAAEVARLRGFNIHWRFFSLRIKNEPPDGANLPAGVGLRCLRVAAAVRETLGDEATGRLYYEMGRRRHISGDRRDIGTDEALREILQACDIDPALAVAAEEERWDETIRADMAEASAKAGDDVGVPIIVLDNGEGPAWFGPVVSRAPEGDEALRLWDAFETFARVPYLFEVKRGRTERPQLAPAPA